MPKTIEAIYEDGVFRPLNPIKGLKKRQKVSITLGVPLKKKHPLEGLCGILLDDDAAELLKIVKEEFEKVDINEW
jgi:predicted DNA-binding antitoxin AbrB/MazE fold protein